MKIPNIINYNTGNRVLLGLVAVLSTSLIAVVFISVYMISGIERKMSNRIFILDENANAFSATEIGSYSINERKAEYIAHVKTFYKLFYSFNKRTYVKNMELSFELIDKSIQGYYEEYLKDNVERDLAVNEINFSISIEKCDIDMSQRPYRGVIWGVQESAVGSSKLYRTLKARFIIEDLETRTIKNPHKAIIKNFDVYESNIINMN